MIKTINELEIQKLLSAAKKQNLRDYTMIFLALSTGLRVSELVGLYIEDVAPFGTVSSLLTVPSRISKNGKKREIPINDEARRVLHTFLLSRPVEPSITEQPFFLFVSKWTKKPLVTRDFQRIVNLLSISSFGRKISPHTLRHTFATMVLKHTNIRVVQELLGHARLNTTQIYTHVDLNDARIALDNFKLPDSDPHTLII